MRDGEQPDVDILYIVYEWKWLKGFNWSHLEIKLSSNWEVENASFVKTWDLPGNYWDN